MQQDIPLHAVCAIYVGTAEMRIAPIPANEKQDGLGAPSHRLYIDDEPISDHTSYESACGEIIELVNSYEITPEVEQLAALDENITRLSKSHIGAKNQRSLEVQGCYLIQDQAGDYLDIETYSDYSDKENLVARLSVDRTGCGGHAYYLEIGINLGEGTDSEHLIPPEDLRHYGVGTSLQKLCDQIFADDSYPSETSGKLTAKGVMQRYPQVRRELVTHLNALENTIGSKQFIENLEPMSGPDHSPGM